MKVIDKRQERVVFKVADLRIGEVYEDEDGDIMIWTQEKKMTILASPEDTAQVGLRFTPNDANVYALIEVSLNIH